MTNSLQVAVEMLESALARRGRERPAWEAGSREGLHPKQSTVASRRQENPQEAQNVVRAPSVFVVRFKEFVEGRIHARFRAGHRLVR